MKHEQVNIISVSLNFDKTPIDVGRLVLQNHRIFFEYDPAFRKHKLDISPFNLPLKPGLQSSDTNFFDGLHGVFNDSLPDGWGRLILDRAVRRRGNDPSEFTALDRLAHVGQHGMGALEYKPDFGEELTHGDVNLDMLAEQTHNVLEGSADIVFDELIELNGSSAGARPKALIGVDRERKSIIHGVDVLPTDYEHWIVKFCNTLDGTDSGAIEYIYSIMARKSGLEMSDTHLFPAKKGPGYFATKRFDRHDSKKLHLHSVCGLLHSDFRTPSLDYSDLVKATIILTRDIREAEKMYRLAVFNVLSNNRDDHSKNFSFLMDEDGTWKLSPAYDLTFSSGPGGEQSTMVMGEGQRPTTKHLLELALVANIDKSRAEHIMEQTQDALADWKNLTIEHGVSKRNISRIAKALTAGVY